MTTTSASPSQTARAEWAASVIIGLIACAAVVSLSLSFDARVAAAAQRLPIGAVIWGSFMSNLGKSGYMFALSIMIGAGAYAGRRLRRERDRDAALMALTERAGYVFAVLCCSGLAAQLVKHLVGRARPQLFDSFGAYHFDVLSMKNSLASFPSGHSTTVFAMATALGLLAPRWRVPLFVLAAGIASARIVVQAHFLSDIVAGAVLGVVSARLVAGAFARRGWAFVPRGSGLAIKWPGILAAAVVGQGESAA